MKKVEIITKIIGGRFLRNRNLIKDAIRAFENKEVVLSIQKVKKVRTEPQNAYYWGIIIPLVKDGLKNTMGEIYSKDEVHEFLKSRFNVIEKVNESTGEVMNFPKSTTANSTTEQEEYHEKIRIFAFEWLGITIPLPNEDLTLEM